MKYIKKYEQTNDKLQDFLSTINVKLKYDKYRNYILHLKFILPENFTSKLMYILKTTKNVSIDGLLDYELEIWEKLGEISGTQEIYGNFGNYTIEEIDDDKFKDIEIYLKDLGFNVIHGLQEEIIKRDSKKYNL